MLEPGKKITLPSVDGTNQMVDYEATYHPNRSTPEEKAAGIKRPAYFSMNLGNVMPGINGITIVANSPSELNLKYKAIREAMSTVIGKDIAIRLAKLQETVAALGDARFFHDAAERTN